MNDNSILLITPKPDEIINSLKDVIKTYNISLNIALTGFEGIRQFINYPPTLLLIDGKLPDLDGMALTSIMKDSVFKEKRKNDYTIYIFNIDKILENTKADYFLPIIGKDFKDYLVTQLKSFFDKRALKLNHSEEIERAKLKQIEMLPNKLETNIFRVDNVFSPFAELSGDGIGYWIAENKQGLCGFLFDCTGHDIVSFMQVSEIKSLLYKGCQFFQQGVYKTLSEVLKNINQDQFGLYGDEAIPTAAIIFFFDFEKNILHYCSAGIPSFYVRYKEISQLKKIEMRNYLIGYEPDVEFDEKTLSLENVDEVIFSSDGFSELFFQNIKDTGIAKHDDVSAIIVTLKRKLRKE